MAYPQLPTPYSTPQAKLPTPYPDVQPTPDMGNGMGQGIGSLITGLVGLLGGNKNPADAAMPYLEKIPGAAGGYTDPYLNAGKQSIPILQGEYGKLINDPTGMYNKFGAGYQESPGYKFEVDQATKAANQAAAAGGMVGSPAEQQELSKVITGLSSQDFNQFLNHIIGLYTQGLGGEQGMFNTGAQTANNMAQLISQALTNQSSAAYAGAANQNTQQGGDWGQIVNGIGTILPQLLKL